MMISAEMHVSKHLHLCVRQKEGKKGIRGNANILMFSTVLCKVDVSKMEGLSLRIEKLRPDCEMKINSVPTEKITVRSNSDLTFQDCRPEDVQVTATRVIGKSRFECLVEAFVRSLHFMV